MALYLSVKDRAGVVTHAYLYRWTHIPTQRWYVGSRTAVGSHPSDGYICSSPEVKQSIAQFPDEWIREILVIGDPTYIRQLENDFLVLLDAKKNPMSFNLHNGDGKFTTLGRKEPLDLKAARVKKLKGMKKPDGFGEKIRAIRTGMKFDAEWCANIGKASKGRIQSESAREKNRLANSGSNNAAFKGYYTSPDGTVFDSSLKAATEYNVSRHTIVAWAKNNKHGWNFTPKEEK